VVDFVSQALLWIYLGDGLPKVAKVGLRGAWEALALFENLRGSRSDEKRVAEALLEKTAKRLKYDKEEMENIWELIKLDPCASALQIVSPSRSQR
jgi:hypothetical protein